MSRLLIGRALQAIPTLFLVSLVAFGLIAAGPVDPARMALSAGGAGAQLDEQDVEAKRIELGLDRPLPERYVRWWADLARLDFGRSFASGRPVALLLAERLAASAALGALALLLSVGVSLPLGMLAVRLLPGGNRPAGTPIAAQFLLVYAPVEAMPLCQTTSIQHRLTGGTFRWRAE